jgi:hypothetical protein
LDSSDVDDGGWKKKKNIGFSFGRVQLLTKLCDKQYQYQ